MNFIGIMAVQYIDTSVAGALKSVTVAKVLAIILIIVLAVILSIKILNIPLMKSRGIRKELKNIQELKNRDEYIIKVNKVMGLMSSRVENSAFRLSLQSKEFMQYNINRAGITVPGGFRIMNAEEFNAVIKIVTAALLVVSLLIAVIKSMSLGIMLAVIVLMLSGSLPMIVLRSIVAAKDAEIVKNFLDYYLMIHYVLISGANTPLDKIMRSYYKITESQEMKRFIDNCVNHIETYGEYQATNLITKDYREIAEVGKLMRLIRQLYDGSDIEQDLMGFRSELIKNKRYEIEDTMNKIVTKARLSFNILTILLVQAILSAMSIYLPDLGMAKGIFGL